MARKVCKYGRKLKKRESKNKKVEEGTGINMPLCSVKYQLKDRIASKGYPVTSRKYRKAHNAANRAEKKRFGKKAFEEVELLIKIFPKGELLGTHSKSGEITVSKMVPQEYRCQVAYHEKIEHEGMEK